MRIVSIDCESVGLYGPVWAIGAVAIENGKEQATFAAKSIMYPEQLSDEWVRENVWPQCVDLPTTSPASLFEQFAIWWLDYKIESTAIADFGVPVEARLFRELVSRALIGPFDGPYPLHELGTLLLAAGVDPDINRAEYAEVERSQHNPLDDARVAAYCWQKAAAELDRAR